MTPSAPSPILLPVLLLAASVAGCHGSHDDEPQATTATSSATHGAASSASHGTVSSAGHGAAASTGSASGGGNGGAAAGGAGAGGAGSASADGGACPSDMAEVDVGAGTFCMDRYEAPNEAGQNPLVMQSAVTAAAWCADRGKRLCTEDEWDDACAGPQGNTYPYGDTHVASRCNDDKTWKVVDETTLDTWPSAASQAEVQKLYQGSPSGDHAGCVSSFGVYDLTGNVEEWVVRTKQHANDYPHVLKGCYWAGCYGGDKPTCASTNPAHADGFLYYETGFRCCKDAGG